MRIFYMMICLGFTSGILAQDPIYNFTFTGGFQGWTSQSIECGGEPSDDAQWLWIDDGIIDQGYFVNYGLMNSRTPDSGIVILNSDFLDNNGLENNIGGGDCPAPQIAELISPVLDFSEEDSVYVSFNQLYYRFLGYYNNVVNDQSETATFVLVSNDGGVEFDTIAINEQVNTFRATQNYDAELTLDLSDVAAGHSEVIVKFLWKGDYYLWAIDDVRFYGGRKDDIEITAFKYPLSNFETPESIIQHDTLRFIADVVNLGNQVVDSAYLYVIVRGNDDNDRSEHFRDSVLIENMMPNDTMEVALPNYFVAENLTQGAYAFIYRLRNTKLPEEVNLANNLRADGFLVSEKKFRKTDRGDGFGYQFSGGVIYANYYQIPQSYQERLLLDKINFSTFAVGNSSLEGKEVIVYLLKIDDDIDADLSNWNVSEPTDNGKTIIGVGSYIFSAADAAETDPAVRFEATEFANLAASDPEEPIILEPGGRYLAAVEYLGNSTDLVHNFGERITYYPSLGPDQFNTMLYEYASSQWYTNGLGSGLVAIIGMDVALEMTPTEELLTNTEVRVFPNPTSDFIRLEMNLESPQNVNVYLTDVSGKLLYMTNRSNFVNGNIEIDVKTIPAGNYFLNVTSPSGVRTEKISVVH